MKKRHLVLISVLLFAAIFFIAVSKSMEEIEVSPVYTTPSLAPERFE